MGNLVDPDRPNGEDAYDDQRIEYFARQYFLPEEIALRAPDARKRKNLDPFTETCIIDSASIA
jgi:hypothetical protein